MRSNMEEFDVVVIGGGINGLTTAAYMAKSGLKTAVIERRHVVGTHCSTEEITIPGVRHNLHASALVTPMSPCIDDLELERFGLELIGGEWAFMHPFQDGSAFLAHAYDVNLTYKMIRRLCPKDAENFKKIINGISRQSMEIMEHNYSAPSEEAHKRFVDAISKIPEIPSDLFHMTGYDLVEYLFEDERVKTALAALGLAISPKPSQVYSGAVGVMIALASSGTHSSFTARGGSYNLPLSLAKCILAHSGTILTNCEVDKIVIKDGEARGVRLSENSAYPNAEIEAKLAVVSNLTAVPTFLHLVGEEYLDTNAVSALKKFDYSGQTLFTAVYATNEPLKWKAREWDKNVLDAYWFHYGAESLDQLKKHEQDIVEGRITDPIVAVGGSFLFTKRDPSQAPHGLHNITTWIEAPYHIGCGRADTWDGFRDEMLRRVSERIEEYSPGFTKTISASASYSPFDIYKRNPSAIDANFAGGNPKKGQFYMDRPFPGCGAPRTPIKKLYISNSLWPWSGSHLTTGYIAACVLGEDLGVRNQVWWVNKPLGWFSKWVKEYSGREWSPFVTLA